MGRPDAEGHRAPSGTAEVMLRQGLGSRSNSAEMGTEVKRGRYPGRKGATESQHRSQGEPSFQEELAETPQSRVGGVKEEGKAVNCWLRNARGRGRPEGRGTLPRLPGPGGKCYLHTATHSHGPSSQPSPPSAIRVDAVVFLSDPSSSNFGRKGEESQDVTEGRGWQRVRTLTLGGLKRGSMRPSEGQRLFSFPPPADHSHSVIPTAPFPHPSQDAHTVHSIPYTMKSNHEYEKPSHLVWDLIGIQ